MADTALESSADVVDFLVEQHERIMSLFDTTLSASGESREKHFLELRRLLAVHEAAEAVVVHPRAEQEGDDGDTTVQLRLQEENEVKTILGELEQRNVDDERFTRQLTQLRGAVAEHTRIEEQDEFATLRQNVSDEGLERMNRAVGLVENTAPTRTHPRMESRSEHLLAGPFVAMVDRARDAIGGKG